MSVGWDGVYEGFPGGVKTFFLRGWMFPNEEESSSTLVHGAAGSKGTCLPLGAPLHSGLEGSFCLLAACLHEVGSLVVGVFVVFLPPHRPPRIRTSVRMVDAIVGRVDGERQNIPTTR